VAARGARYVRARGERVRVWSRFRADAKRTADRCGHGLALGGKAVFHVVALTGLGGARSEPDASRDRRLRLPRTCFGGRARAADRIDGGDEHAFQTGRIPIEGLLDRGVPSLVGREARPVRLGS